MELSKFADELYRQLEDKLGKANNIIDSGISKLAESMHTVTTQLNQLRKFIKENGFVNDQEEIKCFKAIYPKFYSLYIYLSEEFNITTNVPIGTQQMIRDYYLQEIALIKRHFNQNQFSYQYYLNDETALDEDYFLRKNFVPFRRGFVIIPSDDEFTTNEGYSFARFKAYEMLQEFLIKRIRLLYKESVDPLMLQIINNEKRQWTGEKINLIEIAYGIFYTGQMNNGKADLKEIIAWLEFSLNVDLSQAYRMFLDIRRRKTTSYTKFLEQMAESIRHHIDESLIYKRKNKK
ncbi:RteC domain-containing protein [Mucilaginibacter sp. X4EP1]|uniref:RteC domain-containing protein n=1 Tax=Mucilaginibacter sp. X4EP1 TaxID=2723092 RepID=UPI0021675AB9|nr:RteC domain-containing protein [Mucilaginibacter sp. X4EP1]MCS3811494.1 hypothetical protein [Mucilaginibacter sp. X4EP1]